MRILNNLASNHFDEMKGLISGADELYIVSPFLMESFNVFFDEIVAKSNVRRISLVTTLKDNDPDLIRKADSLHSLLFNCIAHSIAFKIHIDNKLHGKIYITCNSGKPIKGFITSANFTDRGMSHNHEWGVEIDDVDSLVGVIDDVTRVSSRALTHEELNDIITKIDDYTKKSDVPKSLKLDLEVTPLIKNKVPKDKTNLRYFIKPVGYSDKLFESTRVLSRGVEKMHFAKRPNSVRIGDILICYAVGTTKLLGYFEVMSDPYVWNSTSRWQWEVEAKNLCPDYSDKWLRFENTISGIQVSFDDYMPVTFIGGKTLGGLQYGSDKIQLSEQFAKHVIDIIENSV